MNVASPKPRIAQKPNLPPKPNPNTPPTPHKWKPPQIRAEGPMSSQRGRSRSPREDRHRQETKMDLGRSEPDGSEMEWVKVEQHLPVPAHGMEETHCHCLCHLHRPGMKLIWVPVDQEEDRQRKITDTFALQREDEPTTSCTHSSCTTHAETQNPSPAQCYSCRSFRLNHRQVKDVPDENVYESMDVFSSQPEEPVYIEVLPSDQITTPPNPPPRPPVTLRAHHRERRKTQPVLAYVLSPRGGRPPIRTQSSSGPDNRVPRPEKLKTEEKRCDGKQSETEQEARGDKQEEAVNKTNADVHTDFEALLCLNIAPRKKKASECVMQGEATLWQQLSTVQESGVSKTLTYTQRQRQECMFEVVTTEATYLRSLSVLRDHFLGSRELDDTLVVHDKKTLFSNIMQVHEVSQRFLQDLLNRLDESVLISDVCDVIHNHAQTHFSVYIEYVRNQVYQEQTYSRLMQCSRAFHIVMRRLEESPLCNRLPFTSFILLPFQRITRIKILIQSILKNTPEGSKEENTAFRALNKVTEMIKQANTQVGQMKQMEELIQVANMLDFDKLKAIPLVSKQRRLEKQGELQELNKGGSLFSFRLRFNPIYVFLFNDLLVLTRRSVTPDRFLVLDYAHRSLVQVQSLKGGAQIDNTFSLAMLENHQGKMCERMLKANTESDLHRWVAALPSLSASPEIIEERVYEDWDCPQVQCIQQYIAKQADELSLEPGDIINIIRKTNEGWWQGIRLSDQATGWFPSDVVSEVTNEHQRRRNLREQYRISRAASHGTLD